MVAGGSFSAPPKSRRPGSPNRYMSAVWSAVALEHDEQVEFSRSNCPQVGQMKGIMRGLRLAVRRRRTAALSSCTPVPVTRNAAVKSL